MHTKINAAKLRFPGSCGAFEPSFFRCSSVPGSRAQLQGRDCLGGYGLATAWWHLIGISGNDRNTGGPAVLQHKSLCTYPSSPPCHAQAQPVRAAPVRRGPPPAAAPPRFAARQRAAPSAKRRPFYTQPF